MMRLSFSKTLAIASLLSAFLSGLAQATDVKCFGQVVPKESPHFLSFPDEHEHSSSGLPEKAQVFFEAEKSGATVAFKENGQEGEFTGKISGVHVLERKVKNGEQEMTVRDLVFNLDGKPFHSFRYYDFYETRLASHAQGGVASTVPIEIPHPMFSRSFSTSFLFYEGAMPAEAVEKAAKAHDSSLMYLRNEHTGVVAIYSPQGISHSDLRACVPEHGKVLGGTRFRFNRGKVERRNSLHFEYLDGVKIQDHHFDVRFRMKP